VLTRRCDLAASGASSRNESEFHAAIANHISLQRSVVKVDLKVASHRHSTA
jgi:hypothetical protein